MSFTERLVDTLDSRRRHSRQGPLKQVRNLLVRRLPPKIQAEKNFRILSPHEIPVIDRKTNPETVVYLGVFLARREMDAKAQAQAKLENEAAERRKAFMEQHQESFIPIPDHSLSNEPATDGVRENEMAKQALSYIKIMREVMMTRERTPQRPAYVVPNLVPKPSAAPTKSFLLRIASHLPTF